jgi:aldehyde:ferredoxin oxidoreductase
MNPMGYWKKLLRVDLSSGSITTEDIPEDTLNKYIGGAGLGAKILWDELDGKIEPLSAENKIIFATGPFQGPSIPGGAKFAISGISPLTGTYGDVAAGASFGPALKAAGYDAILVEGESESPVALYVVDGEAELRSVESLWGLDSYEAVKEATQGNKKLSVCAIGVGGEKLVRFANIVVDGYSFGGRAGLGAIMGSKRLKVVVAGGSGRAVLHDEKGVRDMSKRVFKRLYDTAVEFGFRQNGTPMIVVDYEGFGDMPIKNWSADIWPEGAKLLGIPNYTTVLDAKPHPCKFCPVGCHRMVKVDRPEKYRVKGPGPEYETLGMMGTNCYVSDVKAVAKANDIANRGGLDTISTGAVIGFAMECYEKGWITKEDTGGIDLCWGSGDALVEVTEKIVNREGIGDLLAEGTLRAAREIGQGAVDIVSHCKGLDFPAHDPRSCWSLGPNYATGTRGACHMRGLTEDVELAGFNAPEIGLSEGIVKQFEKENMAFMTVRMQDYNAVGNSLVICFFMPGMGMTYSEILEMYNKVTGNDYTTEDLIECGERVFTVQRMINVRDGYDPSTDRLPPRSYEVAKEGTRKGKRIPFEELLTEYYEKRGWNREGDIPDTILQRLCI